MLSTPSIKKENLRSKEDVNRQGRVRKSSEVSTAKIRGVLAAFEYLGMKKPTQKQISEMVGVSERHVRRLLNEI